MKMTITSMTRNTRKLNNIFVTFKCDLSKSKKRYKQIFLDFFVFLSFLIYSFEDVFLAHFFVLIALFVIIV